MGLFTESSWRGEVGSLAPAPVAEVALAAPVERYELLTDLLGMEDQLGDMDFKIAGA